MSAQGGGVILNVSSLSGVRGAEKFPGTSAYTASKSALAGLTEVLAVEGKPLGIRVVAVSPGAIQTEMLDNSGIGLRAGMTAEELARILWFLASPDARPLSGSNLEIYSNA
jgi:3-oxoacyl-[acyl-carrier protein] reductase